MLSLQFHLHMVRLSSLLVHVLKKFQCGTFKNPHTIIDKIRARSSRCCGCPLCCSFTWVGASHRDNLMHLSPWDRNVQVK